MPGENWQMVGGLRGKPAGSFSGGQTPDKWGGGGNSFEEAEATDWLNEGGQAGKHVGFLEDGGAHPTPYISPALATMGSSTSGGGGGGT